jgi:predicted ester cyclase
MTHAEIATLLDRHKASFAQRDADALGRDHAEDGNFESPAHGLVRGRDAIVNVYRYWFSAFPDLRLDWSDPIIGNDRAAVFWEFSGTAEGQFFGFAGAGSRVEMSGAADYRFAAGEITSVRHLFDFSGVLMKTGVLKVKPNVT